MARFTRTESDFPRSTREGDRGFRPSFSDWLRQAGMSHEWFGRQSTSIQRALSEAFRNDRSPDEVLETLPAEQRPDTTTDSGAFPEPRAVSMPGHGEAFAQKPSPEQIARGAQTALEGTEFFDYTPMPFMPDSDQLMRAKLDAGAQELLDRTLRPDELEAVMQRAREAEVRWWHSRQRIEEAKAAVGFVSDAPTNEAAMIDGVATQIMMNDPNLGGLSATELQERARIARQEARKKFEEDFEEAERMASESFTPFREEDFQLAVQDAIGQEAPFEELGTEMRDAMEGLMGAIAGQVNPQGFVPK